VLRSLLGMHAYDNAVEMEWDATTRRLSFFLSLSREGCFYRELEACPAVSLCCIEGNSSCDVRGDVLADTNALRVD
jgi:hypothetical protein